MLAAPEQLAVEDETRNPENADRFGLASDAFDLLPFLLCEVSREAARIGTGLRQHSADHGGILDVELAFPEAFEGQVVIAAEHCIALPLGVEHAAGGKARVPDLLRAADHQAVLSRLATAIHIAVANPAPLMRVALFLDHPAAGIDPRRAEKARDVEDVREPIDANREVALQIIGEILRQVGVRTLVVAVDRHGPCFGHSGFLSFRFADGSGMMHHFRHGGTRWNSGARSRPPTRRIFGTATIASTPTCGGSTSRPRSISGMRQPTSTGPARSKAMAA